MGKFQICIAQHHKNVRWEHIQRLYLNHIFKIFLFILTIFSKFFKYIDPNAHLPILYFLLVEAVRQAFGESYCLLYW